MKKILNLLLIVTSITYSAQKANEKIIVQMPSLETMQQRLHDAGKADEFKGIFDQVPRLKNLLRTSSTNNPTHLGSVVSSASKDLIDYYYRKNQFDEQSENVFSFEHRVFEFIKNALPTIMRCILPDTDPILVDTAIHDEMELYKKSLDPSTTKWELH